MIERIGNYPEYYNFKEFIWTLGVNNVHLTTVIKTPSGRLFPDRPTIEATVDAVFQRICNQIIQHVGSSHCTLSLCLVLGLCLCVSQAESLSTTSSGTRMVHSNARYSYCFVQRPYHGYFICRAHCILSCEQTYCFGSAETTK